MGRSLVDMVILLRSQLEIHTDYFIITCQKSINMTSVKKLIAFLEMLKREFGTDYCWPNC